MRAGQRALASRTLRAGGVLFGLILLAAILAPVIAPYAPSAQNLTGGLQPPSPAHWFGTDQLGRDVLSRMLFAAQTDLRIALTAAAAPFVIGVVVGLVAGYFGGATDWIASRVTDTVIAFPFYVIVIAIVFAVGAGEGGIIVAFALVGWVGYARVLGAMTASLRDSGWVQAARGGGLSHARLLLRHVLPNVLPQALVLLATEIVLIMVAVVTLGYLGLGIQPPTPDWGTMIADGQQFITTQWWLSAIPGLAVVLTGIALSLLGDGLGDVLRVSALGRSRGRGGRAAGIPSAEAGGVEAGRVRVRGLRIASAGSGPGSGSGASTSRELVHGIDLDVAPGGTLGVVGESGSGKSLTLRAMLGLLPTGVRRTDGEIEVGGAIGMVFQDPLTALDPLARVGSQVREALRAGRGAGRGAGQGVATPEVLELLRLVQLPDPERIARSYPHQLSGGQRQRVVIAMALAGDPAVLLCDEPTTALDVTVQRRVLALLDDLRRERGLTLVFVSHDLAVVASMCDRVAVMRDGRIIEVGETERVLSAPRDPGTRALLDAVPALPPLATDAPSSTAASEARVAATTGEGTAGVLPALGVRGLEVRYGGFIAARDVSFAVPSGGALGIVGESGSGKTSVARAIAGQLPLAGGTIHLDGAPLRRRRDPRIQLVPQDPTSSLNPRMTVGQTLRELIRLHCTRRSVGDLLALVRLDPGTARAYPHELSGGQRQRVALARALAVEPRVLIADEVTSALDVSVQAVVIELLGELRRELGLTLVFISHDLAVVHELCERVVVMRAGAVVEHGDGDFFAHPATAYGRALLEAVPRIPPRPE
ncbi:ATP-binding cassette domain-containing protein [Leucobacter rhizosphaerae]|uniref:ATP-binding cassette domain-containing protein n=1 Tax=Leucobacter rhizosphaerae TaxID=2932245 RepID=A0ABY4FZG5_9MICO|nr:ATP-binding cassette domain-containing protein [Leucobacter rhizosphaerae]UOQ61714.1 ATP-binding cassette domain-containing protein [Leucobacter rhizosphaerae]